jgi:hypothetical protein
MALNNEDTIITNNAEMMALLLQVGRTFVAPQTLFVNELLKRGGVLSINMEHHTRWHADDKALYLKFEYKFTREGKEYQIRGDVQNRDNKNGASIWLCFDYYDSADAGFYERGRPTPAGKRFKRGFTEAQFDAPELPTIINELLNDWENFTQRSCKMAVTAYAKEVASSGTREQQMQKLKADNNERERQRLNACEAAYQKILKQSGLAAYDKGQKLLDFVLDASSSSKNSLSIDYAYEKALKYARKLAKLLG